jgi:CubicO group peptidase (beta-lactamase class C family)
VASARLVDRLFRLLATEQAGQRLPTVVAGVVRDGGLIWGAGRGRLSDSGVPGPTTQYRCGLITKTFVAVCVLRLRDEGALRLTDRLDEHLPGTGAGAATIAQLLSHSSGLRAETAGPWWERTPGEELSSLVRTFLDRGQGEQFEAARRFHYSNVGFGLLGAVVSRLRRMPWEEVVAAELLGPLGMARTTPRPVAPAAPGLAVHPWADVTVPEPEHDAVAMAPAGQLWSTVEDLARWASFLAGIRPGPLGADSLAEMREPRAVNDLPGQAWSTAYGLGLQVWNDAGRRTFGHGGRCPGFVRGWRSPRTGMPPSPSPTPPPACVTTSPPSC